MIEPILDIQGLSIRFPGQATPAIRNMNLAIMPGEIVALVGESGSGKSVSALSVLGLMPIKIGVHIAGSIRFKGQELIGSPNSTLRELRGNRISMIFQEPMSSLNPIQRIGKQLAEIIEIHSESSDCASRHEITALLRRVGISAVERCIDSYPHELSGGQRQRVMIAMAIANQPDLLIADEPTTALDASIQVHILELLRDMRARLGMAILLISHDLSIVRSIADRVAVMRYGEIVETASPAVLFARPAHSYTRQLLAAEPKGPASAVQPDTPIVLEGRAIRVRFPIRSGIFRRTSGHVTAVDNIDLSIRAGETLGVLGESGSGKTTLGLALLKLLPSDGVIRFQGQDLAGVSGGNLRRLRRLMQIVFQDPYGSLSPRMAVGEIVAEGLRAHGIASGSTRSEMVAAALEEVGLDPAISDRYPHQFSGGQRQRIAIARAMVLRPSLLVLDEPTSALDRSVQAQVVDLLRDLQARHGLAYVFISHDLRVVRALASHILVMQGGKVVEQGSANSIFSAPRADYTKSLLAAAFS